MYSIQSLLNNSSHNSYTSGGLSFHWPDICGMRNVCKPVQKKQINFSTLIKPHLHWLLLEKKRLKTGLQSTVTFATHHNHITLFWGGITCFYNAPETTCGCIYKVKRQIAVRSLLTSGIKFSFTEVFVNYRLWS